MFLSVARPAAPRKSGNLQDNSGVVPEGNGQKVEFRAEYAAYVELGTENARTPILNAGN